MVASLLGHSVPYYSYNLAEIQFGSAASSCRTSDDYKMSGVWWLKIILGIFQLGNTLLCSIGQQLLSSVRVAQIPGA